MKRRVVGMLTVGLAGLLVAAAALRAQPSFTIADTVRLAGIREAVRWFGPELDAAASALVAAAPVERLSTAVVTAYDGASLKPVGAVQVGGTAGAVEQVRCAVLVTLAAEGGLTLQHAIMSSSPDPATPEPVQGLGVLAWITFPGSEGATESDGDAAESPPPNP